MVHDVLKSDNWWHEYANHICIIGSDLRIMIRYIDSGDISIDEIKILLEKTMNRLDTSHEIIREVYINDRREELKLLHPYENIRVCSKCGDRLKDNELDICGWCRK